MYDSSLDHQSSTWATLVQDRSYSVPDFRWPYQSDARSWHLLMSLTRDITRKGVRASRHLWPARLLGLPSIRLHRAVAPGPWAQKGTGCIRTCTMSRSGISGSAASLSTCKSIRPARGFGLRLGREGFSEPFPLRRVPGFGKLYIYGCVRRGMPRSSYFAFSPWPFCFHHCAIPLRIP